MRIFLVALLLLINSVSAQTADGPDKKTFPLDTGSGLELINVKAETAEHEGKTGIMVSATEGGISGETLVIIPGIMFRDGTITLELTGEPFDADSQMRKNHSTQYVSHPEYPWYRQRKESPGLYESYVDMEPGKWTKMKIEVTGATARLYLHGSAQPCLVVNDLKHGESEGMIALWLHSTTRARYRDLTVTSTPGGSEEIPEGDDIMNQAEHDRRIDYIEFMTTDIEATKKFYSELFGWEFTDYGPDYTSFVDGRITGGFFLATEVPTGNPLVVLYSVDLEEIRDRIAANGGKIVKEIFEFPGGRRFHFTDPSGNELAVWSDR